MLRKNFPGRAEARRKVALESLGRQLASAPAEKQDRIKAEMKTLETRITNK
jgi:hypothetical protein